MLPKRRNGDQTLTYQVHPANAQNYQAANKEHQQGDQGNCPVAPTIPFSGK